MRMFKVIMSLSTLFALAACGGGGKAQSGKMRIAVVSKGYQHEFWRTVEAGTKKAAEEFGVETYFVGPERETEIAKQVEMVENAINQKVDAVALAACDAAGLTGVAKKVTENKIPLVTFDSDVEPGVASSFIATDNAAAAFKGGEELARLIGGKGKVAIVAHNAGTTSAIERERGFRDAMKKYPGITVLNTQYSDGDRSKALAITQDFLTANPDLVGLFASNEGSAVGMAKGLEESGRMDRVMAVGFDASPDMISFLEKGVLKAIVVQDPFNMGYLAVKVAIQVKKGETVSKMTDTGSVLVTKENMAQPEVDKVLYPMGKK